MKTLILYLKPTGPFHLQTGGGDHESIDMYPKADTLSAAISYWWFRQFEEIPGFPESPPFCFSSIFPAIKSDEDYVRLFPKPPGISIDPAKHNHKVFKKIRWIDEKLFEKWRSEDDLTGYIPKDADSDHLKRGGSVWVSDTNKNLSDTPLVQSHTRTRVVLDRVHNASTPFHFVNARFAPDVHLWHYVDVKPEYESTLLTLIRLLGDEGIGADRTVGMGSFKLETIDESERKHQKSTGSRYINLGIFNPAPEEVDRIQWEKSSYQLTQRGGWVTGTSLRRRPVPCVDTNAILNTTAKTGLTGSVRCVLDKDDPVPDDIDLGYSVYRDCRGYFISC